MSTLKQMITSLSDLLAVQNKDQLHEIRRFLNVPGASQLNKGGLVNALSAYMITHAISHVERLDQKRYSMLKQVMNAPELALPFSKLEHNEEFDAIYFQQYGFLFMIGDDIVMPREIREELLQVDEKQLKAIFARNEEWIQLTQGLLYYYGSLHISELAGKVEHYSSNKPIQLTDYMNVISDLELYDYSVKLRGDRFSHYLVDDPEHIRMEHEMRPTVDFYPVTKAQLLRASEDGYVERHEGYRRFVAFLRANWQMDEEEADLMAAELVDHIRQGVMPTELISILEEQLEFTDQAQIERLINVVVDLYHKTRQWELKGYSPEELRAKSGEPPQPPQPQYPFAAPLNNVMNTAPQQPGKTGVVYDFQTKSKVGRNDPCPCGSGKKFKKCCGG
jgi:hypothetical protein